MKSLLPLSRLWIRILPPSPEPILSVSLIYILLYVYLLHYPLLPKWATAPT